MGLQIRVCKQDLDAGVSPFPGAPPIVLVRDGSGAPRVHNLGGMFDRYTGRIAGPSRDPRVWFVGQKQADILLDPMDEKTRVLLYAAEGAGKSRLMAQWLCVQAVRYASEGVRGQMLATAPTGKRLGEVGKHIAACIPISSPRNKVRNAWGVHRLADNDLELFCGITILLRATKKYSDDVGSPLQGYTALCSADDELQDTAANGADTDIEARLRGSRKSRRMCTASAKDSPTWRAFRDDKLRLDNWKIERIPYSETPFVWPEHWETFKQSCSAREWQRRGLAMDVPPENAVYPAWEHDKNIAPCPEVSFRSRVRDVTDRVLGNDAHGRAFTMLLGHDPGESCDVTLMLRCYEQGGKRRWWVVDEVTTTGTSEAHILTVRERLRNHWGVQGAQADAPRVLVRCDPQGQTERRTSAAVYQLWRFHGFSIRSAQYTATGKPHGRVSKRDGIDMINTLMCNTVGERRLYVAMNDDGSIAAKKLVHAIEHSERHPITGEAEIKASNKPDLSHWCAALRYALWPYEKPISRFSRAIRGAA